MIHSETIEQKYQDVSGKESGGHYIISCKIDLKKTASVNIEVLLYCDIRFNLLKINKIKDMINSPYKIVFKYIKQTWHKYIDKFGITVGDLNKLFQFLYIKCGNSK